MTIYFLSHLQAQANINYFSRKDGECVTNSDLVSYSGQTAESCAQKCVDYGGGCRGFEYNYGTGSRSAGDCWLQSSSDTTGCTDAQPTGSEPFVYYDRVHYSSDFGTKQHDTCVTDNNIANYENQDPLSCAQLCLDYGPSCKGFEFSYAEGVGAQRSLNLCALQGSADTSGCTPPTNEPMDFYERTTFYLDIFTQHQYECVTGSNIADGYYLNQTPDSCAKKCIEYGGGCLGFEFVWGTNTDRDQYSCSLQSSSNYAGCQSNFVGYEWDFYLRNPTPPPTQFPTPPPTQFPTPPTQFPTPNPTPNVRSLSPDMSFLDNVLLLPICFDLYTHQYIIVLCDNSQPRIPRQILPQM